MVSPYLQGSTLTRAQGGRAVLGSGLEVVELGLQATGSTYECHSIEPWKFGALLGVTHRMVSRTISPSTADCVPYTKDG